MTSSERPATITCQACGAVVETSIAQRHQQFHDQILTKKDFQDWEERAARNIRSS